MKKFSDFGINTHDNKTVFTVPKISITDILNCEVEILDYESGVKTAHGDNRYVVKVKHDEVEYKFFTNATPIKEALDKIPKEDFPFATTIKQQKFGTGSGKTFYFT